MAKVKKTIGRVPTARFEYIDGETYYSGNIVTRYGSSFQCNAESTTTPPATLDASGKVVLGEGWIFFADTSAISNAVAEHTGKINELSKNTNSLIEVNSEIIPNRYLTDSDIRNSEFYYVTPYIPFTGGNFVWHPSDVGSSGFLVAYDSKFEIINFWSPSSEEITREDLPNNYAYLRASFKWNGVGDLAVNGIKVWINHDNIAGTLLVKNADLVGHMYVGIATGETEVPKYNVPVFYILTPNTTYTNFIYPNGKEFGIVGSKPQIATNYLVNGETKGWYNIDLPLPINSEIADDAITERKIADNAVTKSKLSQNDKLIYEDGEALTDAPKQGDVMAGYGSSRIVGDLYTGKKNTNFGCGNVTKLTSGSINCSFGYHSLFRITTGNGNACYGAESGDDLLDGDNNVAVGCWAMKRNNSGSRNVAIGAYSLHGDREAFDADNLLNVNDIIAIGYNAIRYIKDGAHDVIAIGNNTDIKRGGFNQIVIGNSAKSTKDNQMVLGTNTIEEVIIAGKIIKFNSDGTVTWENM